MGISRGLLQDAFGKLQVSQDAILLDITQLSNDVNFTKMTEGIVSGSGGSVSYVQAEASTKLTVTPTPCHIVRRSRQYMHYEAGRGMSILLTGAFDSAKTDIVQLMGYGDTEDGVFFGVDENGAFVMRRSKVSGSVVDTIVYQNDWNLYSLKNYDTTGIIFDYTKTNIYSIDLEWLGVGSVFFSIFHNGQKIPIHRFDHNNIDTVVYMRRGSLPVWYSIESGALATENSTLTTICCTVAAQGGVDDNGITRTITRGATKFTTAGNTNIQPLLSIRLKSDYYFDSVIPLAVNAYTDGNAVEYELLLIWNPTIGGTDAASWVSLANSGIEYDISRNNTNILTNGIVTYGTIAGQTTTSRSIAQGTAISNILSLGTAYDDTPDELILAVRMLEGESADFWANMTVLERL